MKKMQRLLLINWSYFSKEIIELGDITFLTGRNATGKTTIIDALMMILTGETNSRNFNRAAGTKSERSLDDYLCADFDQNNPYSRKGKDFSTYIACEFYDDMKQNNFVLGVIFDCRRDGNRQDRFFLFEGVIPDNCFIKDGEAMDLPTFREFLKVHRKDHKIFDTHKGYFEEMIVRCNLQTGHAVSLLKKAVFMDTKNDIQKFITENICEVTEKPNILQMQQNIRDYKRHEFLVMRQEEKLHALETIGERYKEWTQAVEREHLHNFLVSWAEKEAQSKLLEKYQRERKHCREEIEQIDSDIIKINQMMNEKQTQREDLYTMFNQSDDRKTDKKLKEDRKNALAEKDQIESELEIMANKIRQDTYKVKSFSNRLESYKQNTFLQVALIAAQKADQSCSRIASGNENIFSYPTKLFEDAQVSLQKLLEIVLGLTHKAEDERNSIYEKQKEAKESLEGLRRDKKDYPKGLLPFKKRLESGLKDRTQRKVPVAILADVLEISDDVWRGAVEGYLNTQKFYLLVDPEYYAEAISVYDELKNDFACYSFGLVDVGKIQEREQRNVHHNSLAYKIQAVNPWARIYIDYLLGQVVCCEQVKDLRKYKTAITPEGMLYKGYVSRKLLRANMENTFIGQRAIAIRIHKLENALEEFERDINSWEKLLSVLSAPALSILCKSFLENQLPDLQNKFEKKKKIHERLKKIEEAFSRLNRLWLDEEENKIKKLDKEIEGSREDNNNRNREKGKLEQQIDQLDTKLIPDNYEKLREMEKNLENLFSKEYTENIGIPRYRKELERLKQAEIVYKNFYSSHAQSEKGKNDAREKLVQERYHYKEQFGPCTFQVNRMDNEEYEAEEKVLRESELPKYKEKIRLAKESAMVQFQSDFINKLSGQIEQVQQQVAKLNKALKYTKFGTDSYRFHCDPNPDYVAYYDMITSPESKNSDLGLFALPFQEKYGPLIEKLFSQITMADDTELNARKQSELQENIQRYTDFRTYLKFDLETTDQNGCSQFLSKTLNKKSGGETQTPFYIAILASFAQIYRVNNATDLRNTTRLVVFDEAFNRMDEVRIRECIQLIRKLGLQAVICAPSGKVQNIMPLAEKSYCLSNINYRMHLIPYGKEIKK